MILSHIHLSQLPISTNLITYTEMPVWWQNSTTKHVWITEASNEKRQRRHAKPYLIISNPVKIFALSCFINCVTCHILSRRDVTQSSSHLGYTLKLHLHDDDENACYQYRFNSVATCSITKCHLQAFHELSRKAPKAKYNKKERPKGFI